MRNTEKEDLQKHTLLLYKGDYEALASHYRDVAVAVVIRRIIRAHLKQIEVEARPPNVEVNI